MVCEIAPQKQQLKHIGEMLYVNNSRMGRQDKQQHPFEGGGGWSRRVGGNKKKRKRIYRSHQVQVYTLGLLLLLVEFTLGEQATSTKTYFVYLKNLLSLRKTHKISDRMVWVRGSNGLWPSALTFLYGSHRQTLSNQYRFGYIEKNWNSAQSE